MTHRIEPGLLVLHSNRTEWLADAVFQWIARQPLNPLEEEVFLVQSNGVAEWLKMTLAAHSGVCAAARVELPGRFLWRAYRQVLGRDAVPAQSVLDKLSMTWRLMELLPAVLPRPGFEPLARFLADGSVARRLQLAERLADLYDQYQVYRSDWLAAWEAGEDILPRAMAGNATRSRPLATDQLWQAALWRELLATLDDGERGAIRSRLHGRFVAALQTPQGQATPVARRVVLFGMTHVPMQTLEALSALAAHSQVVLAIPNPSQYHWADIIEGRELLQMERRRQPLRNGRDLATVPMEEMHAHGHPLLAAWGRQGRDFVRQLDAFDDAQATRQRLAGLKIDLFDAQPGVTLLQQVQAGIRDLEPLQDPPRAAIPADDRSIVFHVAHSPQREVEILHDQLLALLAAPARGAGAQPLQPRDIVVMVPDIAAFAPAIRSVFGQYRRGDPRFIPFDIADLQERGNNPVLVALEWLLRLPQQRCRASEVRDLLDVPAVAKRFDLDSADLPRLAQWMEGAGIRWGLDLAHRNELDLAACGEQNSWMFGLRRMLLGFAGGPGARAFQGIEPYAEVGGLEASLAGSLADVLGALVQWWQVAATEATPVQWATRVRALLDAFFTPTNERERLTLAAAHDALRDWLAACDTAGFDQCVPLAVAREAWLTGIDAPNLHRRFRAGGVTFCTLMPMRAVPFEVVCLLGMNDGDYPRSSARSDFDLMGLPGQRRPGDRSRRDDDRQLMLEALLSARQVFYVSWVGRSVRDNSAQPPSVLVSQLRDFLQANWRGDAAAVRTTEHPLQPFSRRYFEAPALSDPTKDDGLFTFAREWRAAHAADASTDAVAPPTTAVDAPATPRLTLAMLTSFLKNPVKHFFRQRLGVVFADEDQACEDDESFGLDGLEEYGLLAQIVAELGAPSAPTPDEPATLNGRINELMGRIQRAGQLPMAEIGRRVEQELAEAALPMLAQWHAVLAEHPEPAAKAPLRLTEDAVTIDDWLDGLRRASPDADGRTWLLLMPSRLQTTAKTPELRPEQLIGAWVRSLVAGACGIAAHGVLVGRDASVSITPMEPDAARTTLAALLAGWREGMTRPLPVACRTALAWLKEKDAAPIYEGNGDFMRAEGEEACLAREYPDYEALTADGQFEVWAEQLYGPVLHWIAAHVSVESHLAAETRREVATP
ncbi:DNA helicase/exodeoxyribonuclease V, gamma subunit [Variovorax sp. CF079]|uniref:exodeoxyribonuclease V subunit gamma n=1 Tax=Variovorax sp. CF079 TaxID=1882774 RepID=UPI000889FB39|nr:exodeoxyribonuclease V subunit gamma [Variovorax sp. CF079]SDC45419.1 DNA helicase/exodeoxyribonuclease V, gamma subunit [Variovorax sp. CF079]